MKDPAQIRKVTGIDVKRLDQALEYTKTSSRYGGLLVARHGYLVYEKYFGRASREVTPNMASCGKMFTSVSWGILLKENPSLAPDGLETKVFTEKYLPEAFPLSDPRKAEIKLGHLLTMTSGMGTGGIVNNGEPVRGAAVPRGDRPPGQDLAALQAPMWTNPGGGYAYSNEGVHTASIVLRHLAGMEMQEYIDRKLAKPMQFGGWGYAMQQQNGTRLEHTPGAGSIALRATDALRFGYLLLRGGRWGKGQLIPADYLAMCSRRSPYNPHSPFSLQFEVNEDGHVAGAPLDAFFKSGAGGFCIYACPSLDLTVYKMSCVGLPSPAQYDLGFGGKTDTADDSRDNWKPRAFDQFHDGPIDGDAGTRRAFEMVVASILE